MANDIFSGRVDEYVRFRLDYPPELRAFLDRILKSNPAKVVADIGSGTGLLARWFLERDLEVYGVDPNEEMRLAAAQILASFPNFHCVNGSSEHTTLESHSIDLIAAGNAFHWFDQRPTKAEFKRILKPTGHVLLLRTDWKKFPHARMGIYDQILTKYCKGRRGLVNDPMLEIAAIQDFFASYNIEIIAKREFDYTYEELVGRFLSTSYAPKEGHPEHLAALNELGQLFEAYAINGRFPFGTITTAVYGVL